MPQCETSHKRQNVDSNQMEKSNKKILLSTLLFTYLRMG